MWSVGSSDLEGAQRIVVAAKDTCKKNYYTREL